MFPIGCVFINDDDMDMRVFSRVCRKLNIDAAQVVIGFDGKKDYPVTQEGFEKEHIIYKPMIRMNIFKNHEKGYVICKENEEAARSANYNVSSQIFNFDGILIFMERCLPMNQSSHVSWLVFSGRTLIHAINDECRDDTTRAVFCMACDPCFYFTRLCLLTHDIKHLTADD